MHADDSQTDTGCQSIVGEIRQWWLLLIYVVAFWLFGVHLIHIVQGLSVGQRTGKYFLNDHVCALTDDVYRCDIVLMKSDVSELEELLCKRRPSALAFVCKQGDVIGIWFTKS